MASLGAQLERCNALLDVQNICVEYGDVVRVWIRGETDVARDDYSSVKTRKTSTYIDVYAYPIETSPNQKQIEKAGLKERADVQIYTPMKSWTDASLTFDMIDITRASVDLQGHKYRLKEKSLVSQFVDTYLYITLGLYEQ